MVVPKVLIDIKTLYNRFEILACDDIYLFLVFLFVEVELLLGCEKLLLQKNVLVVSVSKSNIAHLSQLKLVIQQLLILCLLVHQVHIEQLKLIQSHLVVFGVTSWVLAEQVVEVGGPIRRLPNKALQVS